MKSLKVSFTFLSKEATREDVSIGLSLDEKKAKLTLGSNSSEKKTQLNSETFDWNMARSMFQKQPKPQEKKEETTTIEYNEDNNTISAKYREKDKIDILKIDTIITTQILTNTTIKNLEKKKDLLLLDMDRPLSMMKRKRLRKEYEKLEHLIKQNTDTKQKYKDTTKEVLEKYRLSEEEAKLGLVNQYLMLATRWVNFDLYIQHKDRNICVCCGHSLRKQVWYNEGIECPKCNVVNMSHNRMVDTEKIPTQNIKGNKRQELTFMKRLAELFCTKNIDLPNDLKTKLDKYFESKPKYKNLTSEKVKKLPLIKSSDLNLKRGKTSVAIMTEALEQSNLSAMYKHVRYICKMYWGWYICDFSHRKNDIIVRYRITSAIYNQIKEGSSNLKADFHLYKILQSMDIGCTLQDFKPIKGTKTLNTYENYWLRIEKKILKNKEYQYHHDQLIDWNIDLKKVLATKGIDYEKDPYFNGNIYEEYRYHIRKAARSKIKVITT